MNIVVKEVIYLIKYKRKRIILYLIIVFTFVLGIYVYNIVNKNIKPTILGMCEIQAKKIATQAINDAVKSKITGDIKYKDLLFVKQDNQGRITMVQANTGLMNSIASEIALEVQDKIRTIPGGTIKIPIGSALKSQIFSGPNIKLKLEPYGSVTANFGTDFLESGINQTIHRVHLVIITDVKIVFPLASDTVTVKANIPIAETIIVGGVPDSYMSLPKDDMLNIVR